MVWIIALLMALVVIGILARRYDGRTNLILVIVVAAAIALFYKMG